MNLYNLTARLTLDTTDYDKKIKETKTQNEGLADKIKGAIGVVSANAWVQLGKAVLDVMKKIADVAKQTIDYADNISDLAQNWGFTTREIQEFDYWATMSGTTLESLLTGMRGLVNQAEAGGEAFEKLGVKVKNADGSLKDQKTLFLETIDALKKVDNQTERNALQFEIFGRAGIELGQVINRDSEELMQLSKEAEGLGIILSEDTIDKAGNFNDTLDQMRLSFKSIFAEVIMGGEDAPEKFEAFLNSVVAQFESWFPKFLATIVQLFPKVLSVLWKLIPEIPKILMQTLMQIEWNKFFWDLFKGLVESIVELIKTTLGSVIGYGWLWGKKEEPASDSSAFKDTMTSLSKDYISGDNSYNNKVDNSSYNIEINMTSSGYTKEDARNLVDDVIKEISTKKQASGR